MAPPLPKARASRCALRALLRPVVLTSVAALSLALESNPARGQPAPLRGPEPAKAGAANAVQPLPPDGLNLEDAVLRFLADNLELRAMRDEIAMAQADVVAAGQMPQAALHIKIGAKGIEHTVAQPWELPFRRWIDMLQARTIKTMREA